MQSEYAYDEHAGCGEDRIYFCIRDDLAKFPAFPGKDYPHYEYGYAVITSPDGEILSITSRWNYGDDENDDFLTREQLEELLPADII